MDKKLPAVPPLQWEQLACDSCCTLLPFPLSSNLCRMVFLQPPKSVARDLVRIVKWSVWCCLSNLFHIGNRKSKLGEVSDRELTEPDLNGVICWVGLENLLVAAEKNIKLENWLVPWRGSLHWSHFGRLFSCRVLQSLQGESGSCLGVATCKH